MTEQPFTAFLGAVRREWAQLSIPTVDNLQWMSDNTP
jgi:hypothetical protein